MYTSHEAITYAPKELETDRAHFCLRLSKLLFFGTEYLCGVDPPVLKLEIEDGVREYVSVVCLSNSRDSPPEELVSIAITWFLLLSEWLFKTAHLTYLPLKRFFRQNPRQVDFASHKDIF